MAVQVSELTREWVADEDKPDSLASKTDEGREEEAEEESSACAMLAIDLTLGKQTEGAALVEVEGSCHAVALRASEVGEAEELYETDLVATVEAEVVDTVVVAP